MKRKTILDYVLISMILLNFLFDLIIVLLMTKIIPMAGDGWGILYLGVFLWVVSFVFVIIALLSKLEARKEYAILLFVLSILPVALFAANFLFLG